MHAAVARDFGRRAAEAGDEARVFAAYHPHAEAVLDIRAEFGLQCVVLGEREVELRADAQAIMVGSGTALTDRPALTVRDVGLVPDHAPMRVLVDARGRVPAVGPLFETALAPTLVVTTVDAAPGAVDAWRSAGAKVEVVAPDASGTGVDLDETFARLVAVLDHGLR